MPETKGVEAVDRALSVLECFGPGESRLSLAELARRSGLYKSTILRLAVSLERFGYLIRDDGGAWRLGPAAWRLGALYRGGFVLADRARPALRALSEETQETASFYVREGSARLCLYRAEPVRSIRHSVTEGTTMPLERGASGRVLLAFSPAADEGDALVREAGHAVSLGERDAEVAAIAVPVMGPGGRLVGALSVSGLITRFSEDRRPALLRALDDARAGLEPQLVD